MEWIQEIEESDGLDDAGTLVFGSEKEQKPQRVYPAAKIKIDRAELELRNFTLLSGVNSSGKTSIIQAILFVVQMLKRREDIAEEPYVDMGRLEDLKNNIKGNSEILFEVEKTENEAADL